MTDSVQSFKKFREMINKEVYSEPDTAMHTTLINSIIPDLVKRPDGPKPGQKIVDIGCGSGLVFDKLVENGLDKKDLIGVTTSDVDREIVEKKGYECHPYDMSFTEFENETFDYAIVRHCLEHSAWPYMTLMEFNRIMKTGGRMYIEMPAPGGDRKLEHFENHYSVMGQNMWGSLMIRTGFEYTTATYDLNLNSKDGKTTFKEPYHWYIIEKIVDRSDYRPATTEYMKELNTKIQEYSKNKLAEK